MYKGYEQRRFISGMKDINEVSLIMDKRIGKDTFRVIGDVIKKLSHMNGSEISEYSHGDTPYLATKNIGDILKSVLFFYRSPQYEYVKENHDIEKIKKNMPPKNFFKN